MNDKQAKIEAMTPKTQDIMTRAVAAVKDAQTVGGALRAMWKEFGGTDLEFDEEIQKILAGKGAPKRRRRRGGM